MALAQLEAACIIILRQCSGLVRLITKALDVVQCALTGNIAVDHQGLAAAALENGRGRRSLSGIARGRPGGG
jgi:hypothetical protein